MKSQSLHRLEVNKYHNKLNVTVLNFYYFTFTYSSIYGKKHNLNCPFQFHNRNQISLLNYKGKWYDRTVGHKNGYAAGKKLNYLKVNEAKLKNFNF